MVVGVEPVAARRAGLSRSRAVIEPDPWPAREDLPPERSESEEHERALAGGLGIAGFICSLLGLAGFFIPFLDLLLALGGVVYSGRAVYLAKDESGAPPTGVALAVAGLVLGVLAVVPGVLISYDAAFRH
jgi:hypothetical protein